MHSLGPESGAWWCSGWNTRDAEALSLGLDQKFSRRAQNYGACGSFDLESTLSARMMRLHRRDNVAPGGGISVNWVVELIAASSNGGLIDSFNSQATVIAFAWSQMRGVECSRNTFAFPGGRITVRRCFLICVAVPPTLQSVPFLNTANRNGRGTEMTRSPPVSRRRLSVVTASPSSLAHISDRKLPLKTHVHRGVNATGNRLHFYLNVLHRNAIRRLLMG